MVWKYLLWETKFTKTVWERSFWMYFWTTLKTCFGSILRSYLVRAPNPPLNTRVPSLAGGQIERLQVRVFCCIWEFFNRLSGSFWFWQMLCVDFDRFLTVFYVTLQNNRHGFVCHFPSWPNLSFHFWTLKTTTYLHNTIPRLIFWSLIQYYLFYGIVDILFQKLSVLSIIYFP